MLMLKRRTGENLRTRLNVSVTVLVVKGCQVKIGTQAPFTVKRSKYSFKRTESRQWKSLRPEFQKRRKTTLSLIL
nr:carbon storage regulator [Microbulbifer variabilis]